MLDELQLEYTLAERGGAHGGLTKSDYLALNPNGRVPTLRDGELVVWESHAILRYLAAVYSKDRLWPDDPRHRAAVDQWTDWTATRFQLAWMSVFWRVVRTPRHLQEPDIIAAALEETHACLQLLDDRLAGTEYLAGPQLSYADIAAGVSLYRWFNMPVQRKNLPNVTRWYEHLKERPAFQANVMVSFDDLRGRLEY
ncbi:glutathione S-transferase [Devosia pacifica]|uniref:Glutathione S-transferase n=1 Tax=Devosia pacifica TaxID=1335967 RepID=A0A918RSY4_9HYPH|nr:glutathione S-transferase [Devosia pacifica]